MIQPGDEIDVDYDRRCECNNQKPIVVNHNLMWHDGDVICQNCEGYIRGYDAG
jgi:predicted SprT family Zn-dependent metalloprotease